MGFADGFYYGQGRIIVDTNELTVGDTIRVRSYITPTKYWDGEVETVGTPIVFDVPSKDRYYICKVVEISNVETEICKIYRTVDYGQTMFVNLYDKNTLAGIQIILDAHDENNILNVGDEVTIDVDGTDFIVQIAAIDLYESHEVIFCVKNVIGSTATGGAAVSWATSSDTYKKYRDSTAKTYVENFYNNIDAKDRKYLKDLTTNSYQINSDGVFTSKVWIPSAKEALGETISGYTPYLSEQQYPIFLTSQGRTKVINDNLQATSWWLRDHVHGGANIIYITSLGGSSDAGQSGGSAYLCPCFHLTADV